MTMEFITLLLAIITALLLMPHINRFVKLARVKVKNYDSDISKNKKEIERIEDRVKSLDKSIQDLIILQGSLSKGFEDTPLDLTGGKKLEVKNLEGVVDEMMDAGKVWQNDLEDKDMFQPLDKFKKKRKKHKFKKPTPDEIKQILKESNIPMNEKEYDKVYKRLYAKKYYTYVIKRKKKK